MGSNSRVEARTARRKADAARAEYRRITGRFTEAQEQVERARDRVDEIASASYMGASIAAGGGTPIHAAADGRVIRAGYNGGYGNYTCIGHGRLQGQGSPPATATSPRSACASANGSDAARSSAGSAPPAPRPDTTCISRRGSTAYREIP